MTALTDLVKLANINGGKIPATIPAHYVRWAAATHKDSRQVRRQSRPVGCIDAALNHLRSLVEAGIEYPDAEYKASTRFNVSADALRSAYDNQH